MNLLHVRGRGTTAVRHAAARAGFAMSALLLCACARNISGLPVVSTGANATSEESKVAAVPHLLVGVAGARNAILEFGKSAGGDSAPLRSRSSTPSWEGRSEKMR
jgi:hypothetical protein